MSLQLPEKYRKVDDNAWLDLLIRSISSPVVDGVQFPGFPAAELQVQFVGASNETTLREAFKFYVLIKQYARDLGNPLGRESRLLDFGCGWGRFLRFFWKDVGEGNLFGCDINQMIVDTCHKLNVPGQIDRIERLGTLPYPDSYFDVVMAHSVFTHLPEKIHLHWLREIARVTRPKGVFFLTLEPRRFIEFIATIPADTETGWFKALAKHKPQVDQYLRSFDSGNLVFMPTNEGYEDKYGDAAVPVRFIEREWGPYFRIHAYIDDPGRFWQAVLVAQRL